MSENINKSSEQNLGNIVDKDSFQNLANNLLKNQNSFDFGSIMQMATTLLNNDSLLNSVKTDLSKKKQNPAPTESKVSKKQKKDKLASLSLQLENIANGISGLKQENVNLATLPQQLENITNDISGLKQENVELASLSQKLENCANDFSELKQELKDVKEQNRDLIKLIKNY
jgi:small-conductance mechanosensitive channel